MDRFRRALVAREGEPADAVSAGEERLPVLRSERWMAFALVAALSLIPIALVRYPPVLDLAQQTAQIPLLLSAFGEQADVYRVQWFAPNKLSYPLLALGWFAGGAEHGARIGLALCLVAALGAIHYLAAALERPIANAALASILVWTAAFYGGYFSFMLGGFGLALWLRELAAPEPLSPPTARFVRAALASLLLYESHLLWLAAACGLLLVLTFVRPAVRARGRAMALAILPFCLAAWAWNVATQDWKIEERVVYVLPVLRRLLDPRSWCFQILGGVRGPLETTALLVLALLGALTIAAHRRERNFGLHATLTLAAAAFGFAALVLPDKVDEGIQFAQRWASVGLTCALLALPSLPLSRRRANVVALAFVGAFVATTAQAWVSFDREMMRGFDRCRAAVPENTRLLFLDLDRFSPRFWHFPTYQMGAYARLDHDLELGFSFAEHRSSLVVYRQLPRAIAWTRRLEHEPQRLRPRDLEFFDTVLMHVPLERVPELDAAFPPLERIEGEGAWWLFRVRREDRG